MKSRGPAQHSDMETLFAQISAITDNEHEPTYEDTEELTQALQGLHMSQILGIDDVGAVEERPNEIGISSMNESARNDDDTIGGWCPGTSEKLHALIKEYGDILS